MIKHLTRYKYFCGLDLGVGGIKASLVRVQDEQNLDLIGVHEQKTAGFKGAVVSDLTELAECIGRAMTGLRQKYPVKIQSVHLGIGSECVNVQRSTAVIPLLDAGSKVIARSDIKRVNHQARLLGTGLEEEVIHDFPQYYKVDDGQKAVNPLGLYGRKLETNLLLVLINANRLRNIVKAVHQASYEVSNVTLSGFAASEVVLDPGQKAQGSVLIDMGADMTTVFFFKGGILGDIQFIPWGGNYLTQNLAEKLGLTIDLAEDIKRAHAVASAPKGEEDSGEILVKREKDYLPVSRQAVCASVNWEIENLLTHLETVVKGSALFHDMNGGIVMTGGGALLPGLMERIERRLKIPVRMGTTKGLNQAALFSASIGLAQMGYLKNIRETVDLKTPGNLKIKITERVKELCQEYF